MQYIRSISGSVSNTWNSINPATLSGAIDVIVVEQEDGTLACSPFHVRFGKFSLLRPSEKKVEFAVNGEKKPFPMKLGEGGEAFFVFETSENVPHSLQTSPVVSPVTSPTSEPLDPNAPQLAEPDELDLAIGGGTDVLRSTPPKAITIPGLERRAQSDTGNDTPRPGSPVGRPKSGDWSGARTAAPALERAQSEFVLPSSKLSDSLDDLTSPIPPSPDDDSPIFSHPSRSSTMPLTGNPDARARIINLSKKLFISNISNQITDSGNLALDMKGYAVDDRTGSADALRVEAVVRKILEEELDGNSKIGDLIGVDEKGNLTVYGSEEAKEAAERRSVTALPSHVSDDAVIASDAMSDPGYHSDDDTNRTVKSRLAMIDHHRRDSDSAVGLSSPPKTPEGPMGTSGDPNKNYAKTLRLTSDQLKELNLKPGENKISFTANRVSLQSSIYMWNYDVPIVISDIDGTITKSDVMGHVMNAVGRDWTHLGVAKLYTDIVTNGYNIFYLTSRSVGQADSTRAYLHGIVQDGYKLPRGPVILSPDRTWDALRREIYLRKPEVFKMACLRDIMNLFNKKPTPFYAGFGNRQTDAYSYRSVGIPSTRIFTINSNAEVSLDLLSLGKYKTGYAPMQEIVDHFFPPTGLLVTSGGEDYTDFNYWRDRPLDIAEFSDSESDGDLDDDDDDDERRGGSLRSEDDRINEDLVEDLQNSLYSRPSIDDSTGDLSDSMIMGSLNGDSILERDDLEVEVETEEDTDADDEDEDLGGEEETMEAVTPTVLGKVEDETHMNLKDLSHVLNSPAMSIKAAVTGSPTRSGRDDVSVD